MAVSGISYPHFGLAVVDPGIRHMKENFAQEVFLNAS
jgi:hypothetical protein